MKALVAAIALLCLSSTVLAHDIYSNLRDRDGHLCCGGQDCRPVQVIVLPNGSYYLPSTGEIMPVDMAAPSPDDRFHHCVLGGCGCLNRISASISGTSAGVRPPRGKAAS